MSRILQRITSLFRSRDTRYLKGTDLSQNRYYEYPSLDGDPDPRRTRRLVRYRAHKELDEYDQSTLPTQWMMWLRHTRRSAPTIQELQQDEERIAITRHNALVLEQREMQRRMQLEAKAQQDTLDRQLIEQESYDSRSKGDKSSKVPTSTVQDKIAKREAEERVTNEHEPTHDRVVQHRKVDMEVWEASRRRLSEQEQQQRVRASATSENGNSKSELDKQESERERARKIWQQSPLSAFDVSYVEDNPQRAMQQQQQEQTQPGLNKRFGRSVGPSEDWSPQDWQPNKPARRS